MIFIFFLQNIGGQIIFFCFLMFQAVENYPIYENFLF